MKVKVLTGLDRLGRELPLQKERKGNVAYLCNAASLDRRLRHGISLLKETFGSRLKAVFAPQHGLAGDAQDNMIESPHFFHSYYEVPVYSLYSEVRQPTGAMLEDVDHLVIDLPDVGVRVYTYLYTALLAMEACGRSGVEVTVLDRPNPLGGTQVSGNMLDPAFKSFIGLYPLPMCHGMTIGELAKMAIQNWKIDCSLNLVKMEGWQREMPFEATGLPWVLPSPNFPSLDTAAVYPGTVLLEGTNLSEGRGTVKPFECFGHPALSAHRLAKDLHEAFSESGLKGFQLRSVTFRPTFDKFSGELCHGYQLHVTDHRLFRPWHTCQVLLRELYRHMGEDFQWRQPPFEYEAEKLPIDILNGTDRIRQWVESGGSFEELKVIENEGRPAFWEQREQVLLY